MLSKTQAYRLMPWAWLVAWLLTGVGATISDIYSSPSKSLIPFILLSVIGWAVAGFITARASSGKSSMAVQLIAWAVAYLVVIPFGRVWMQSRDVAPVLLYLPFVLAGAIWGFASSLRPGAWRLISGTLVGFVFLLFSPIITLYAGLILMMLYSSTVNRYGDPLSPSTISLFWVLTQAVFGLVAGFAARWILGFKAVDPTSGSA